MITKEQVNRLFLVCRTPAAASRAALRVYRLAERSGCEGLRCLADALHTHQNVLLARFAQDSDLLDDLLSMRESMIRAALANIH